MAEILNIDNCEGICGIYKINFPNGKAYIGKAVDIKRRMKEHNSENIQLVDKKIKEKIGFITEVEILERIKDKNNLSLLNERERYWISYYKTYEDKTKGYNQTPGGDGAAPGVDNVSAKINEKQLQEVYQLLINSDLFIYEIAKKYNISSVSISDINCGRRYFNKNFSYPLRKPKSGVKTGTKNHLSKFNDKDIDNIYDLLINHNEYSLYEIADMNNVHYATISAINRGIRYNKKEYSYPLRKINANSKLSQNDIDEIYNLLKTTSISLKKIGEQYNVSQDTIIRINKGLTYVRENYNYPIRERRK